VIILDDTYIFVNTFNEDSTYNILNMIILDDAYILLNSATEDSTYYTS